VLVPELLDTLAGLLTLSAAALLVAALLVAADRLLGTDGTARTSARAE
jgi:hypothetical protein